MVARETAVVVIDEWWWWWSPFAAGNGNGGSGGGLTRGRNLTWGRIRDPWRRCQRSRRGEGERNPGGLRLQRACAAWNRKCTPTRGNAAPEPRPTPPLSLRRPINPINPVPLTFKLQPLTGRRAALPLSFNHPVDRAPLVLSLHKRGLWSSQENSLYALRTRMYRPRVKNECRAVQQWRLGLRALLRFDENGC